MEAQPREIQSYVTPDSIPFDEWFLALRNGKAKTIINKRLDRVSAANLGDYRSVGEGVCELRIDYGAGQDTEFILDKLVQQLCFCSVPEIKALKTKIL